MTGVGRKEEGPVLRTWKMWIVVQYIFSQVNKASYCASMMLEGQMTGAGRKGEGAVLQLPD